MIADASGASLVDVKGLTKRFDIRKGAFARVAAQVHAVENVSFQIKEGEVLGLAGESGSGKTTIGRMLLRLIEASSGSIRFMGEEIAGFDRARLLAFRGQAQIVFQDPFASLDPTMTVGEAIAEPLRIQGMKAGSPELRQRIAELLEAVALQPDFTLRRPEELSGGQRQRVVIARALSVNPKFIVADEPVSSLDVSIQAQIIGLLERLQRRSGLTMLFISHDLAVMEYMSDRIAVLYLGRLMEIGPAHDVIAAPKHPYTEALISAIPDAAQRTGRKRVILTGEIPSAIAPPAGCVFHTRCRYALAACTQGVPELRETRPGHYKACIRDDLL
ncbi:MAG: ABC transporter ATP-binding protein [Alphaproteobacteria bacterium]|nr:ABC transporter ATP-binding protein [Alphaproteobacteria bacterium]